MAINPDILDKLRDREAEWSNIQRCINVNICPRCGNNLAKIMGDKECRECKFSSNTASFFKRMY